MSCKKAEMHPEQPHSRCADAAKREYYKNANVPHLPMCTWKFEGVCKWTHTHLQILAHMTKSDFSRVWWRSDVADLLIWSFSR